MALGRSVSLHPDFSSLERSLDPRFLIADLSLGRSIPRSTRRSVAYLDRQIMTLTSHRPFAYNLKCTQNKQARNCRANEQQKETPTETASNTNTNGALSMFQETFDNLGFLANAEGIT